MESLKVHEHYEQYTGIVLRFHVGKTNKYIEKNYIIALVIMVVVGWLFFLKFMTFDLDGFVCGRTLCEQFRKLCIRLPQICFGMLKRCMEVCRCFRRECCIFPNL